MPTLTLESINDALIECVKSCGGSKAVGVALWPANGVEAAQRQLLACLNPDRNEKLGPDEVLLILRMARDRGCHAGMQYLAETLGYATPVPVAPQDGIEDLIRQYLARRDADAKTDAALSGRIEQYLRAK